MWCVFFVSFRVRKRVERRDELLSSGQYPGSHTNVFFQFEVVVGIAVVGCMEGEGNRGCVLICSLNWDAGKNLNARASPLCSVCVHVCMCMEVLPWNEIFFGKWYHTSTQLILVVVDANDERFEGRLYSTRTGTRNHIYCRSDTIGIWMVVVKTCEPTFTSHTYNWDSMGSPKIWTSVNGTLTYLHDVLDIPILSACDIQQIEAVRSL